MNKIMIYTDGACSGNPGPGGWGAVLIYPPHIKEISGSSPATTNNIMELTAVIEALKLVKNEKFIEIYTDSKYVISGITEWIKNWKKNNWRNAAKQAVKNQELWQELDQIVAQHSISWHWVKGHSGDKYNERADQLAVNAINHK